MPLNQWKKEEFGSISRDEIDISIAHRLRSTKNPDRSALFPIHLTGSIKRRATHWHAAPTMSLLSKYSITGSIYVSTKHLKKLPESDSTKGERRVSWFSDLRAASPLSGYTESPSLLPVRSVWSGQLQLTSTR